MGILTVFSSFFNYILQTTIILVTVRHKRTKATHKRTLGIPTANSAVLIIWSVVCRFMSRPGGRLPIYISVESIPPWRVMWTGHGIETSIPTTRKDRSPHQHHTPLCTTTEDWRGNYDAKVWCFEHKVKQRAHPTSETSKSLWLATFSPDWFRPKNEKSLKRDLCWKTCCHTNSSLFCSRPPN